MAPGFFSVPCLHVNVCLKGWKGHKSLVDVRFINADIDLCTLMWAPLLNPVILYIYLASRLVWNTDILSNTLSDFHHITNGRKEPVLIPFCQKETHMCEAVTGSDHSPANKTHEQTEPTSSNFTSNVASALQSDVFLTNQIHNSGFNQSLINKGSSSSLWALSVKL